MPKRIRRIAEWFGVSLMLAIFFDVIFTTIPTMICLVLTGSVERQPIVNFFLVMMIPIFIELVFLTKDDIFPKDKRS